MAVIPHEMALEQGNYSINTSFQGVQSQKTPEKAEVLNFTKDNDRQIVTPNFQELSSGINSRGALRAMRGPHSGGQ